MSVFALREMIYQGWPVLSVLFIMSILSITVIVDRMIALRRAAIDPALFLANLARLVDEGGAVRALASVERVRKPLASVAAAILRKAGKREAMQRALRQTLQKEIHALESYVPILGSIGSTAPFVGLFGTVMGIIKAFQDISANMGGGAEVVSAGIAEALITTAFGLLVAIPAVIGYNYCVRRVQRLAEEIDMAAEDLIDRLEEAGV